MADWETLREGEGPGPRVAAPLTRTDIVRYQGASGDFHPAHHDDAFARQHGYAGAFSLGMLHAGVLAAYATDWLGPDNVRRFKVRFREVVWPGDVLTYSGHVLKKYEDGAERKVDVELACRRPTGATAVEGWATFVVP